MLLLFLFVDLKDNFPAHMSNRLIMVKTEPGNNFFIRNRTTGIKIHEDVWEKESIHILDVI